MVMTVQAQMKSQLRATTLKIQLLSSQVCRSLQANFTVVLETQCAHTSLKKHFRVFDCCAITVPFVWTRVCRHLSQTIFTHFGNSLWCHRSRFDSVMKQKPSETFKPHIHSCSFYCLINLTVIDYVSWRFKQNLKAHTSISPLPAGAGFWETLVSESKTHRPEFAVIVSTRPTVRWSCSSCITEKRRDVIQAESYPL